MLNIPSQIVRIEGLAASHGVSIKSICVAAGVAPSNWARWKKGETSPSYVNWQKVLTAAGERLNSDLSEPTTASSDNKAHHDRAAPDDPIPEISESLRPVQGLGDGGAVPASEVSA